MKVSTALAMDENEARSSSRQVMLALGTVSLMEAIAASPLDGVRAARKRRALCAQRARTLAKPRPLFPGSFVRENVVSDGNTARHNEDLVILKTHLQ